MTQEEKQLLLNDLCARLPYGVKAKVPNHINPLQIFGIEELYEGTWAWRKGTCVVSFWDDVRAIENIKPYLRPMSSMTKEEKDYYDSMFIEVEGDYFAMFPTTVIDYLNSHHFDYRGLIEKGLALEAPEGMYERNN